MINFEIFDPVVVAISKCFIFFSDSSEGVQAFHAFCVSLFVLWDMVFPEVVDCVKFIIIFKVEFLALVSFSER